MKRILLAGATLLALTAAQPTLAADAPVYRKASPPAAAVFSWQGLYIGLQAGYGWGNTDQFDDGGPGPSFKWDGGVVGGTLGYNWQAGALVLGLEGDLSWSGIKGSITNPPGWGCGVSPTCHNEVKWFGTARGRVGYAMDRALIFATAGVAWGRLYADFTACAPVQFCIEETRSGWTAGGGLEWAFAPNWSAKVEYLYVDLGSFLVNTTDSLGMTGKLNVVRGGVNWRFAM